MSKYSHVFSLYFSLPSSCRNGTDIKAEDVIQAVRRRLNNITPENLMEVIGSPEETIEHNQDEIT